MSSVQIVGAGRERENGNALVEIFKRGLIGLPPETWRLYVGCGIITASDFMLPTFMKHGMETDLAIAAWFDPPLTRSLVVKGQQTDVKLHSLYAAIEVKGGPAFGLDSLKPYVVYNGESVFPATQAQASGTAVGKMLRGHDLRVWVSACVWLRGNAQADIRSRANSTLAVFFGSDATLDDVLSAIVNGEREQKRVIGKAGDRASVDVAGKLIAPREAGESTRPRLSVPAIVERPTYQPPHSAIPWQRPADYTIPRPHPSSRAASQFSVRVPRWPFVVAILLVVIIMVSRLAYHPEHSRRVTQSHRAAPRHARVAATQGRMKPIRRATPHSNAAIASALSRLGTGAAKPRGNTRAAMALSTLHGMH